MADPFRLDGKVVVLTGAAGVIGTEAVLSLIEAGARICAIDRSTALLRQKLGAEHGALMHNAADMSNRDALQKVRKKLESKWGVADALLKNAVLRSRNYFERFEDFQVEEWNEVMAVNLTGAMLAAQVFGSAMAERGHGSIVNMLSVYASVGPDQRIYKGSMHLGQPVGSPVARLAQASDVANAMRYLVSDASKYVTGHNLVVDGGWTAW